MGDNPDKLESSATENKAPVKMGFKFWLIIGLFYLSLLLMVVIVLVSLLLTS